MEGVFRVINIGCVCAEAQGLLLAGGLEDGCDGEVLLVHTG
jgi:hypothetical protein